MKPHVSWLLLAALLSPALTDAQERRNEFRLNTEFAVTAPPQWQVAAQNKDSLQLYVKLRSDRQPMLRSEDDNPKPTYVLSSEAGLLVSLEYRRSHPEALRRLAEIAAEFPEPATLRVIGGWPAIERTYRSWLPQPGDQRSSGNAETLFTTTAIAVDTRVLRFETMFAPDCEPRLIEEALAIGREVRIPKGSAESSRRELDLIRSLPQWPKAPTATPPSRPGAPSARPRGAGEEAGVAVLIQTGLGEIELATNNGQNVVMAANSGYSFSANAGATWTFGGGTPCNQTVCDGDPSLAVGASGNFYYAWIGGPTNSTLGDGISRSINNGQTFTFQGMAATCPGLTNCTVADQEHIAADRNNPAAGGGDLVYNVWRDFGNTLTRRISCSSDSGVTWTTGAVVGANGDFPRVSVGGDGFVYVAWAAGGNMMLHKFSNCDNGLVPQVGWPVTVAAFSTVVCPVPGLDRCNGRNLLSSPKVAVDDLDPNHVYYAFATSSGAGNENILVFDSTDGGATFPRSVQVNGAVAGRRFMPWISTYGGIALVSWYDRRTATLANNDWTRFYIGGAAVRGPNLQALPELDLSGNNDTQCSTWPCATNNPNDSESCSIQPQNGGRCGTTSANGAPCDFSAGGCPAGQTCLNGRGCPKYGDYNGNTAAAGRFFSAWASAVPPAAVGGAAGSIRLYSSTDRVPSDFYVRDWNNSPSFDNGAQPSTNPVFWTTSDVWNQNSAVPQAPSGNGSVIGDPPSHVAPNFVFAKVARRAPAMPTAPDAVVTVNFYLGDFGMGSPFVPIGSEVLTFTAADTVLTTPAHAWTLPAMPQHLCLAVQIVAPDGDTFSLPSVEGTAPGPADPFILIDNNKAQRNLQEVVGGAGGVEFIALIRNLETKARIIRLRARVGAGKLPEGALLEVIGGRRVKLVQDARLELPELAPGAARWVRLRVPSLKGLDRAIAVDLFEDSKTPANGFTVVLRQAPLEQLLRRSLDSLAGVFARLAQLEDNRDAAALAKRFAAAVRELDHLPPDQRTAFYQNTLAETLKEIDAAFALHLRRATKDPFENRAALDLLRQRQKGRSLEATVAATTALVERLDARLTQLRLERPHS